MSRRTHCRQRRGAAVVAMVITLLLLGLIMIGMVVGGARDQDLTAQRMNTALLHMPERRPRTPRSTPPKPE